MAKMKNRINREALGVLEAIALGLVNLVWNWYNSGKLEDVEFANNTFDSSGGLSMKSKMWCLYAIVWASCCFSGLELNGCVSLSLCAGLSSHSCDELICGRFALVDSGGWRAGFKDARDLGGAIVFRQDSVIEYYLYDTLRTISKGFGFHRDTRYDSLSTSFMSLFIKSHDVIISADGVEPMLPDFSTIDTLRVQSWEPQIVSGLYVRD